MYRPGRTGFSDKLSRDGASVGIRRNPGNAPHSAPHSAVTTQRCDHTARQRSASAGPLQAARELQRVRDRLGDARRAGRFAGVAPDADMPAADALSRTNMSSPGTLHGMLHAFTTPAGCHGMAGPVPCSLRRPGACFLRCAAAPVALDTRAVHRSRQALGAPARVPVVPGKCRYRRGP